MVLYVADVFSQDEACLPLFSWLLFHSILIGAGCLEHYFTKGSETRGRLRRRKRMIY